MRRIVSVCCDVADDTAVVAEVIIMLADVMCVELSVLRHVIVFRLF